MVHSVDCLLLIKKHKGKSLEKLARSSQDSWEPTENFQVFLSENGLGFVSAIADENRFKRRVAFVSHSSHSSMRRLFSLNRLPTCTCEDIVRTSMIVTHIIDEQ
ncbi:hypothetical protein AVEN_101810-1 [Araneus ventricosus]|uniref:Uncharacterized protein n=1 Tax=Araneus ventricosus TaxID=182803 RepID=A0A4Y2D0Z2_ARAVE|nr:hypothetical protein AVEN_101810-1 [Araneus ventricosus]